MSIRINQYQFDAICRQMEKEFGKIKKGEEEQYMSFLYPIECNLLMVHREFSASNSRRLLEAIPLALFQLKSNMTGEEYDLVRFGSEDNERLVHAILMAFDPLTNEKIAAAFRVHGIVDLDEQDMLKKVYAVSIMCILRIKESVEFFVQELGTDGYFDFLEENIGVEPDQMEGFHFTVMLPDGIRLEEQETGEVKKRRSIFSRLFKKRS